jgi:hypothetical protein
MLAEMTQAVDQSPKGRSKRDDRLSLRPSARSEDGLGAADHVSLYPPTNLVQLRTSSVASLRPQYFAAWLVASGIKLLRSPASPWWRGGPGTF